MRTDPLEPMARRILTQALREERSADLLRCLWEGGSATVDAKTGLLVLATAEQFPFMTT